MPARITYSETSQSNGECARLWELSREQAKVRPLDCPYGFHWKADGNNGTQDWVNFGDRQGKNPSLAVGGRLVVMVIGSIPRIFQRRLERYDAFRNVHSKFLILTRSNVQIRFRVCFRIDVDRIQFNSVGEAPYVLLDLVCECLATFEAALARHFQNLVKRG